MTLFLHCVAAATLWTTAKRSVVRHANDTWTRSQSFGGVGLALSAGYAMAGIASDWAQPGAPQLMLLTLAHLVGAAYDCVDGLVPDAVWLAAVLGWILLRFCGLAQDPDTGSMSLSIMVCGSLLLGQATRTEKQAGGADLAAILCGGLLMDRFHMALYLIISTCLALTARIWGQRSVPFIPYCLSALVFLSLAT